MLSFVNNTFCDNFFGKTSVFYSCLIDIGAENIINLKKTTNQVLTGTLIHFVIYNICIYAIVHS